MMNDKKQSIKYAKITKAIVQKVLVIVFLLGLGVSTFGNGVTNAGKVNGRITNAREPGGGKRL